MLGTKQTLQHKLKAKKLSKKPKFVTKKRQQGKNRNCGSSQLPGKAESGVLIGEGQAPSKLKYGQFPEPDKNSPQINGGLLWTKNKSSYFSPLEMDWGRRLPCLRNHHVEGN